MAIDSLLSSTLPNTVGPAGTGSVGTTSTNSGFDPNAAAEFRGALDQAAKGPGLTPPNSIGARALESLTQTRETGATSSLKFSTHAVERMRSRGISIQPEMMKSIEGAVQKAAAKGSKDTLVLAGDNALIVSVKNNTVVTVMDRAAMKENVFTNIDSTVVL